MTTMQKEYCDAFETAETHLKDAELFVKDMARLSGDDLQGLLFPAVNELRYAGYHASKASAWNGEAQNKAYAEALHHCHRSCYDSLDLQIQYCLGECRKFQKDYELVSIGNVIKDYQNDCLVLNRVNQGKPRSEDAEQDWLALIPVIKELKTIHQKWFVGRDELNKILEEKRNTRWLQFLTSYGTMVSAISAVIAAACAIVVLFTK